MNEHFTSIASDEKKNQSREATIQTTIENYLPSLTFTIRTTESGQFT